MQSVYTLQQSLNYASIYCRLQPLTGVGSFANEPGLTICNTVAQIILGAPLKWRWNRTTLSTSTVAGNPVATLSVLSPGYSFIERAFITSPDSQELEIKQVLPADSTQGRPMLVSPQIESATDSNIGLSFFPTPDKAYSVSVTGQNAAKLFTSLASTWAPIPDYMGHIYNTGVLALSMLYSGHQAFPLMFSRFLASLAGAAEGLSEQERSVFLGQYQYLLQAQQSKQALLAMGEKGLFGVQA